MKNVICAILAALLYSALFANAASVNTSDRRLAPIDDPIRATFTTKDQRIDRQKIKAAIAAAAAVRDWRVMGEADGRTTLSTSVRGKHFINLDVNYDDSGFQLQYLNSANLLYVEEHGKRLIHRNYNVWVRELATSIGNVLGVPVVLTVGQSRPHAGPAYELHSQPSTAALVASGFADINDIDAVPVQAEGKPRYQHYLTLPSPKAFAISESGAWRFYSRNVNAAVKALEQCEQRYPKCWLYAVDDRVVWNADAAKRVGLNPQTLPVP